ncbi:hypothetical protein DL767_002793 [Monosporascus sp. MG133]|nr:hypothetical protein DL767_002793 [Monosporascus sp. MG133]
MWYPKEKRPTPGVTFLQDRPLESVEDHRTQSLTPAARSIASEAALMRHTVKLPDPKPLDDGESPTFETWEASTGQKIKLNCLEESLV